MPSENQVIWSKWVICEGLKLKIVNDSSQKGYFWTRQYIFYDNLTSEVRHTPCMTQKFEKMNRREERVVCTRERVDIRTGPAGPIGY